MRLIDADLMLNAIKVTPQFDNVFELLERVIEHFPTAYDVDKVIKEIENIPNEIYEEICEDEGSGYYYNGYKAAILKAIIAIKSALNQ